MGRCGVVKQFRGSIMFLASQASSCVDSGVILLVRYSESQHCFPFSNRIQIDSSWMAGWLKIGISELDAEEQKISCHTLNRLPIDDQLPESRCAMIHVRCPFLSESTKLMADSEIA
jgi:hypothetical protein